MLVILAKIELRTELSSSIEVELDKERTCEGGKIMSDNVKGCLSSLANKVEDWLCGRLPNMNDLLSSPSDGCCEDGVGEADELDEDFFSETALSMSLLNSSNFSSEDDSGISASFEPESKSD